MWNGSSSQRQVSVNKTGNFLTTWQDIGFLHAVSFQGVASECMCLLHSHSRHTRLSNKTIRSLSQPAETDFLTAPPCCSKHEETAIECDPILSRLNLVLHLPEFELLRSYSATQASALQIIKLPFLQFYWPSYCFQINSSVLRSPVTHRCKYQLMMV
jgi:hypothetical protein